MDDYIAARPDIFFTGRDGRLRSNRVLCQLAGQYAVDAFIGSTLQMDGDANSSTVTKGRLAGFGGAPNMGHDPHGRRHASPAWLDLIPSPSPVARGRKLVVQVVETFHSGASPAFVETLDAVSVGQKAGMPIAPIMIYGDDVSHVVTEEGIAYLYKADGQEERRRALAAVAGVSPIGSKSKTGRNCGFAQTRDRRLSGRHWRASSSSEPFIAGGAKHGRSCGLVGRPLSASGAIQELVNENALPKVFATPKTPPRSRTQKRVATRGALPRLRGRRGVATGALSIPAPEQAPPSELRSTVVPF